MAGEVTRLEVSETLAELHAWVNELDLDEMAALVSELLSHEGNVVIVDDGFGYESDPHLNGARMKATYALADKS